MNSWFAVKRYKAVPSSSLIPYYFGYCIGRPELLNPVWIDEWRRNEPIGCRNTYTVELLRDRGIKAHLTGCLTAWIGRFIAPPKQREGVIFVDVPEEMERFIPPEIRERAHRITNDTRLRSYNQKERFKVIAENCDRLRHAELVVTRRLHTALPCVGFGTPVVVYLNGNERNRRRFSGIDQFLPIIFHDGKTPVDGVDWLEPTISQIPTELEEHFQALTTSFGTAVAPRWSSMAEFVETLPDLRRVPRSFFR